MIERDFSSFEGAKVMVLSDSQIVTSNPSCESGHRQLASACLGEPEVQNWSGLRPFPGSIIKGHTVDSLLGSVPRLACKEHGHH